jgi:hypothetical protein
MVTCDLCGKQNCSSCMSEKGLLFQKHYCKNKCDLIVKEEIEKKGFFGKMKEKI